MVNLSNIGTSAVALLGAGSSLVNVLDFQGNCMDSIGGRTADFTAVESYACGNVQNQIWNFTQVGSSFQITLKGAPTAVVSIPFVGSSIPSTATSFALIHQQAQFRSNSVMTWQVQANNNFLGKFNIIANFTVGTSFVAVLTSWPKRVGNVGFVDSPSAPLTLTQLNLTDPQQVFSFVTSS